MTEEQLRALLRLKRYEQPPPGYFDQLLRDIHRRQRAELLRRPLWKIAIERMQTFFGEHSMSSTSYAGAMATVLIFGVGIITVVSPNGATRSGGTSGPSLAQATTIQSNLPQPSPASPNLSLQIPMPARRVMVGAETSRSRSGSQAAKVVRYPRYVMDALPVTVSYEPTNSF